MEAVDPMEGSPGARSVAGSTTSGMAAWGFRARNVNLIEETVEFHRVDSPQGEMLT
jgi:hypothetical protein